MEHESRPGLGVRTATLRSLTGGNPANYPHRRLAPLKRSRTVPTRHRELNKDEAGNSLARAVGFHRLGRFRNRQLENQQLRSSALILVTPAIVLYNSCYLGRAVAELHRRGIQPDPALLSQLSPLGWDRINLTGEYVWSDRLEVDA